MIDCYVIASDLALKFFARDPTANDMDFKNMLLSRRVVNNRSRAAVQEQYIRPF